MVVFKNELYAAYYNPNNSHKIYKYDRDAGTWSAVFSGGGTSSTTYLLVLHVDNDVLYAIGENSVGADWQAYVSTDGSTFTDKNTLLGAASTTSEALPILFGFEQISAFES